MLASPYVMRLPNYISVSNMYNNLKSQEQLTTQVRPFIQYHDPILSVCSLSGTKRVSILQNLV